MRVPNRGAMKSNRTAATTTPIAVGITAIATTKNALLRNEVQNVASPMSWV